MDHMKDNFPEITEIVCPGDLVGYYARPLEVVEAILDNRQIIAVTKGNWDHAIGGGGHNIDNFNVLAQKSVEWHVNCLSTEIKTFLYQLPATRTCMHTTAKSNHQIALIHGSPNYPLEEYIFHGTEDQKALFPFMELIDVNVLLLGHTHKPFIDKQDNRLMINPGSVGQPRDKDPRASYAVVDLKNLRARIVRVEYDVEKVYKQVIDAGLPEFIGKRLYKGI